jgi:thiol:disulfide interchange protein DsbD
MKQLRSFLFFNLVIVVAGFSQTQDPVKWNYMAKKLDDRTYEIHMKAVITEGWHIYAQQQPEDAIALPTKIKFNNNPLLAISGKVNEVGTIEKQTIKELGIVQYEYAGTVEFVQLVKLKASTKTTISGSVTFQACTQEQCLPPKQEVFNLFL